MASFPSVRIEGGLLGPELLDQVCAADVPGQKPTDFGLEPKRNLTDEIAAVFADSRAQWGIFKNRLARLPEDDLATTVTRDTFVIPFLGLLGYELTYNQRALDADGQSYAISHAASLSPQEGRREKGEGGKRNPLPSPLSPLPSSPAEGPPIPIVGARQELGRVPPSGRPRLAPHSLVQEFLNRTEHVWGIVTNGLTLRLLRDSTLVRRQAYIEFDLQAIFEEQRFHDFAALYRLLHRSRLPRGMADANECLLGKYHAQTIEQGGRVREHLRDGVEECLKLLGNGFLTHPENEELRQKINSGQLTPAQFYRQLFRIVYRFLFLLVSEDRGLISPNPVYRDYYSIARLRRMLDVQAAWTDHADLWLSLRTLWKLFGDDKLAKILDLAPLNGELFAPQTLDDCTLSNRDLLHAFWYLAYYQERAGAPARRVNYSALDVEELGSVYESLLEFHPDVATDAAAQLHFDLIFGSERKTTGSFYTPPELVNELIESALMPVVRQRLEGVKRMANSEWRMVDASFHTVFQDYANQRLSRSGSLANRPEPDKEALSGVSQISRRGEVRADLPNPPGGGFDSLEHSGGMGTALHSGVHPVPPQSQRQPDRSGDATDPQRGLGIPAPGGSGRPASGDHNPRQETAKSGAQPGAPPAEVERLWRSTPFAIRYSLFAAQALLSLKVIDIACGSGHMLLAAARRVGKELAKLRTGEDEPAPERVRESIRDVISHCIYGVDRNPLAVDLCRVALWLESHTAGKPLTFLDHRIRCGDSLVGAFDISVLKNGIPDKAFDPCEGDDKTTARAAAKKNKEERRGAQDLFAVRDSNEADALTRHSRDVDAIPDDSPELIRRKKELFEASHRDPAWLRQKQACDIWTAAFFQTLTADSVAITSAALADHLGGRPIDARLHGNAATLALRQPFLHWPLEFPEVFAAGGFDVILSNPPWERIKLQETEFFAIRDARIATAPNKAVAVKLIKELAETNPTLHSEFTATLHNADCVSKFLRQSERFPLTATGDINTYAVFAETIRRLLTANGRAGVILPTGIATDATCQDFFADINRHGALVSLFDFENREAVFQSVHRSYKFCTFILSGRPMPQAEFAFYLGRTDHLRDARRRFTLSADDLALFNPNTRTCPVFRTRSDAELTRKIYKLVPVLVDESKHQNPWSVNFLRMIDPYGGDWTLLSESEKAKLESAGQRCVPVYEGKMFHQFDHRLARVVVRAENLKRPAQPEIIPDDQKIDPHLTAIPQYWVTESAVKACLSDNNWHANWLLVQKKVTSTTNERTHIATILPLAGTTESIHCFLFSEQWPAPVLACLLANLNALVFDYIARQKLGGVNFNYFVTQQLPVLPPNFYQPADVAYVASRVLELVYTADDMQPLADALRAAASPLAATVPRAPYRWDEARRALLRAELDAWFARAYGLTRDELRYILDPADVHGPDFPGETFRVLKEKELAKFGEYRTRRLVLEAWDRLT